MARVYTERLSLGEVSAGSVSGTSVYTVPDGKVVVLRDAIMVPVAPGGNPIALMVYVGSVRETILWYVPSPGDAVTYHMDMRQVLVPGESLHMYVGVGDLWYALTGYVFDAA